jgi:hypothetical protein
LVALGPLEQESEAVERTEHDKRRDVVAAMEKALAGAMRDAGYRVMNDVRSRKELDLERVQRRAIGLRGKLSGAQADHAANVIAILGAPTRNLPCVVNGCDQNCSGQGEK